MSYFGRALVLAVICFTISAFGCRLPHRNTDWLLRAPLSCESIAILSKTSSGKMLNPSLFRIELRNHTDKPLRLNREFLTYLHYSLRYTDQAGVEWRLQPPQDHEAWSFQPLTESAMVIQPNRSICITNTVLTKVGGFTPSNGSLITQENWPTLNPPVRFSGMYSTLAKDNSHTAPVFYYVYCYGYIQ